MCAVFGGGDRWPVDGWWVVFGFWCVAWISDVECILNRLSCWTMCWFELVVDMERIWNRFSLFGLGYAVWAFHVELFVNKFPLLDFA